MANDVFTIAGKLILDDDDYVDDLKKDEKETEKASKRMTGSFEKIGKGVGLATGAIAAATAAAGALVIKATETTATINKFSQVTGTTTEQYQEWDSVLKSVGFSMEDAAGDFAALGEKAFDAANGVGEGAELFGMLGVNVEDTSGKMKTQGEIFDETIAALQQMEDVTERNAIASALLGTTGEELVPILNMTNEELQNMKNNANVIDQEQLDKAAEFKKGYDQITQTLGTLVTEIGISLMPILMALFDWIQSNMPTIRSTFETVFGFIGQAITFVTDVFNTMFIPILKDVFAFVEENWPAMQEVGEGVFGALFSVVQSLWALFSESLLPILVSIFEFVKPTFPIIGEIIGGVFDAIIMTVNGTIAVFKGLLDIINSVIDAFKKFFRERDKAGGDLEVGGINSSIDSGFLGGSVVARANGGRVAAGQAFAAGERGREIFVPSTDGTVIPAMGNTTVVNINNPKVFDTRDANRLGDLLVTTLRNKGVNPNA